MAEHRAGKDWTRDETLIAFRLYCCTPFGKLHQHNPDIIALARRLGRTPSAIGMKACNFASLDPLHRARGVVGLRKRGKFEDAIWEQFVLNAELVAQEAEAAYERMATGTVVDESPEIEIPTGETEATRTVRARLVQRFFRNAVLVSYQNTCAVTGLKLKGLLNASHIIPWSVSVARRADPSNGICLNALHDRAFDRGYFTFDDDLRIRLSSVLLERDALGSLREFIAQTEGQQIRSPERFAPALDALRHHREHVFQST